MTPELFHTGLNAPRHEHLLLVLISLIQQSAAEALADKVKRRHEHSSRLLAEVTCR